jgi:hypothetical protein
MGSVRQTAQLRLVPNPQERDQPMKSAFPAAALVFLVGITIPASAREERGQGGPPQAARPAQQQARPVQQQRQDRPAARAPAQIARPAQPQHVQQASRPQQPRIQPANRAQQASPGRSPVRAQQSQSAGRVRGGNEHGRISNDHYAARFGSEHRFHVNRRDYDHRRFRYGGYAFGFIDPWPIGWDYSDDVFVEYTDGGYYMYDRVQPGVRIAVNIL